MECIVKNTKFSFQWSIMRGNEAIYAILEKHQKKTLLQRLFGK